ncbi:MAG: zf-HC2 domain-containing protein [candidate division Zixibacteria bacterium]|nr:zf-HC2 domain-containing protein [candidate division Zixibacteria bacterium]
MKTQRLCQRIQSQLPDHINKKLNSQETNQITAHLADCPACREEYRLLEQTYSVLRNEPEINPPDLVPADFARRIREHIELKKSRPFVWQPRLITVPAVLALVFILAVSFFKIDLKNRASQVSPAADIWLEESPAGNSLWTELLKDEEELSQELRLIYWESENVNALVDQLTDEEFEILEENLKNRHI